MQCHRGNAQRRARGNAPRELRERLGDAFARDVAMQLVARAKSKNERRYVGPRPRRGRPHLDVHAVAVRPQRLVRPRGPIAREQVVEIYIEHHATPAPPRRPQARHALANSRMPIGKSIHRAMLPNASAHGVGKRALGVAAHEVGEHIPRARLTRVVREEEVREEIHRSRH